LLLLSGVIFRAIYSPSLPKHHKGKYFLPPDLCSMFSGKKTHLFKNTFLSKKYIKLKRLNSKSPATLFRIKPSLSEAPVSLQIGVK
jgi:hypothetical protein